MDHFESFSHKNDILVIINDYFLEIGGGGGLCRIAPLIHSRLSMMCSFYK